jgi:hypothetical protein
LLAGCAEQRLASACPAPGERPTAELVFARVQGGGRAVSEADFARFLKQEISQRFPDGLTVVDAQGRWAPPAGGAIHGPSKTVMVVLHGGADDRAKLEAIRTAYAQRFHQPSALMMGEGGAGCIAV